MDKYLQTWTDFYICNMQHSVGHCEECSMKDKKANSCYKELRERLMENYMELYKEKHEHLS